MSITYDQALTSHEFHGEGERPCTSYKGPVRYHRNGATQTWKRTPGKFRIPVKYGLYTYGQITDVNARFFHVLEDCPLNEVVRVP